MNQPPNRRVDIYKVRTEPFERAVWARKVRPGTGREGSLGCVHRFGAKWECKTVDINVHPTGVIRFCGHGYYAL